MFKIIRKKMVTRFSAVAATAACALAFSAPANAEVWRTLYNWTGKCLAVPHASNAEGVGLIGWQCSGGSEQQWALQSVEGGVGNRYRIKSFDNDLCLAIPHGNKDNGVQAIQWDCTGAEDQLWIYDSAYRLRNVGTDRCLALPNPAGVAGPKAIQWTCGTNSDQRWTW
ncbi:RICIN domain-containing protein [Nonomuraea sp. NPDC002799]